MGSSCTTVSSQCISFQVLRSTTLSCIFDAESISRSYYILFLFVGVAVKGHRFALFVVDLLFYVGSDSRYIEEAHCAL